MYGHRHRQSHPNPLHVLPPIRDHAAYQPLDFQPAAARSAARAVPRRSSTYPDHALAPVYDPSASRISQPPPRISHYSPSTLSPPHVLHLDTGNLYYDQPDDMSSATTYSSSVRSPPSSAHFYPESSLSPASPDVPALPLSAVPDKPAASSDSSKRKTRRERPRIALAPDQPPTTQGKPRARVYVACVQCRNRKIRCDGAKPVCHNCSKRSGNNECTYDAVPKRRGPDKTPGARQRMSRNLRTELEKDSSVRRKKKPKLSVNPLPLAPLKHESTSPVSVRGHSNSSPESSAGLSPGSVIGTDQHIRPSRNVILEECPCHHSLICPNPTQAIYYSHHQKAPFSSSSYPPNDTFNDYPSPAHAYITAVDDDGSEQSNEAVQLSSQPSPNFTKQTWWDSLLSICLAMDTNHPAHPQALTSAQRDVVSRQVTSDLRFLFKYSNFWLSFFHVPSFFTNYFDPVRRERVQPSLIYAMIALSTFMQSSELELGHAGRIRALRYRDEAESALQASVNAGWIDETLAQAAFLLALFEISAHPNHSLGRGISALAQLDSIIHGLHLTDLDRDDPNTTFFAPEKVPTVSETNAHGRYDLASPVDMHSSMYPRQASPMYSTGCNCANFTLGRLWSGAAEYTPMWQSTAAWSNNWSEADIRKESCRRLCWSSINMASGHTVYASAPRHGEKLPDLFITDPANYAVLFSGESVCRSPSLHTEAPKDTVWALYDRSFLLWHSCYRMRNNPHKTDAQKAEFAMKAWLETDTLEQALDKHTCDIERGYIFQGREYLFNTRMCISYEFRRFIPLVPNDMNPRFYRPKVDAWLTHQSLVAERVTHGLHAVTGFQSNSLVRRPFFVFWFMGLISRFLALWQCDNTLTLALEVAKKFVAPIEYLSAIWPCPDQRRSYELIRERLDQTCYMAGITPPPPPSYTLPVTTSQI